MVQRSRSEPPALRLPPGRYRVFGFPPMTGLLLNKWIDVRPENRPGCYGAADIPIATAMPELSRIEDERGHVVWPAPERS